MVGRASCSSVRIPIRPGGSSAYEKVERKAGDWACAAAGAAVWLTSGVAGWSIDDVDIEAGRGRRRAPVCRRQEEVLQGKLATEENVVEAARIAAADVAPSPGQRGQRTTSATYQHRSCTARPASGDRTGREGADLRDHGTGQRRVGHTREVEPRLLLVRFLRDELRLPAPTGDAAIQLRRLYGPVGR